MSQDAPPSGTCVDSVQVGNIIIRSNNTAVLPVGVYRCTQILDPSIYGAGAYSWQPIGHYSGATLPAKCAVGEIAFRTGAAAGQNIFGCTTPNVWTLQSGGGGDAFAAAAASKPDGMYCVSVVSGVPTLTPTGCPGTGGGALSWGALTNSNWTAMTNAQWTALSN